MTVPMNCPGDCIVQNQATNFSEVDDFQSSLRE